MQQGVAFSLLLTTPFKAPDTDALIFALSTFLLAYLPNFPPFGHHHLSPKRVKEVSKYRKVWVRFRPQKEKPKREREERNGGLGVGHKFRLFLSLCGTYARSPAYISLRRDPEMESHLLYDGEPSTRDEGRRRMLSDAGVGSGSCWRNPRTWGLIIGLLVVIASIVLIIVLVTLPTTGKNAKQVKSIIDNSKKATLGFNRLGYEAFQG